MNDIYHNNDCLENKIWNNDSNLQSLEDIIRILIDFLGEFLIFLSSIIECKQSYFQFQLKNLVDIAERIHQFRLILLRQINNCQESILNISSISQILHEFASCIHCLNAEQQQQQQIETIIEYPHINIFSQLLDRLEKTIKSCIDYISMKSSSQNYQASIPIIFPCLNSPYIIDNPSLINRCWSSCNTPNTCIPWSLLEEIKCSDEKNPIFGLMYGIKDENIRRKLGYNTRKHKSLSRSKQKYEENNVLNDESNYDSNHKWTDGYTNDQMLVLPKISNISTKQKLKSVEQTGIRESNGKLSTNSIISQKKNSSNRFSNNRTISRLQSIFNSKQPSSLSRSNLHINDPIKSRSIHDHLMVSNPSGRMKSHIKSSHTKELPITSMLDHSESQRISSRQMQQPQSNIFKEETDKSVRSMSFQSYGYRIPSKSTIKMSDESNQNLSPVQSKSIRTQQSNGSIQSRKVPSINEFIDNKSISSIARSSDKRSFKENSNQNPSIYSTHANNIDSAITLTSPDEIKYHDSISNRSLEQRLASPVSIVSAQRMNSNHLKQKNISPMSNKQLSLNEPTSDFNFDDYSQYQMFPSASFHTEMNNHISSMNVIEGPQSAEGEESTINLSDNNNKKKDLSTSDFSLINTIRQRSTSATSNSNDSISLPKIIKHSSRSMTKKNRKFYIQETTNIPFQSNEKTYFNKFMHCFRKTTANQIDRSIYQHK